MIKHSNCYTYSILNYSINKNNTILNLIWFYILVLLINSNNKLKVNCEKIYENNQNLNKVETDSINNKVIENQNGIIYSRDDDDDTSKRTRIKQEHNKYQQYYHISNNNNFNQDGSMHGSTGKTPQYTVKLGETILIPCIIENRKQATVIWQYSKSRIPETLTVGYFYYRKDYRIRVIANASSEHEQSWNLEIRKVKLDDEGFYLCKVMAEPQSLKQIVYLRVNVDLKINPVNPLNIKLENTIIITCNTSYELSTSSIGLLSFNSNQQNIRLNNKPRSSKLATLQNNNNRIEDLSTQQQQQQQPRLLWYKDGEQFSKNEHHFSHHHQEHHHANNQNQSINYKIEYFSNPVLWSRIIIKTFKHQNIGKYTCKFRNQNVSTIISPYLAESLLNMKLIDKNIDMINYAGSNFFLEKHILFFLYILIICCHYFD